PVRAARDLQPFRTPARRAGDHHARGGPGQQRLPQPPLRGRPDPGDLRRRDAGVGAPGGVARTAVPAGARGGGHATEGWDDAMNTVSTNDRVLAAPGRELGAFLGPKSSAEKPHEESPFLIFQKVHRLLRGRYHVLVPLAVAGAIIGASAGWMSSKPKFLSV